MRHFPVFFDKIRNASNNNSVSVHLEAVLDTILDGLITIDREGKIFSFNRAAVNMFGYTEEQVIGQNVRILMPDPFKSEHDTYIRNFFETGNKKIIGLGREVLAQRKDGSIFPVELRVNEMEILGETMFVGTLRDITDKIERKKEELEQQKYEAESRKAMLNILEDLAHDKELLEHSQSAMLNILEDFTNDKSLMEASQKATLNILEDFSDDKELMEKTQKAMLNILEDASNERIVLESTQTAVLNILEDYGDEKDNVEAANKELEQIKDTLEARVEDRTTELREINQELENFAYVASHDLKSPLVSCKGFLGLLKEDLLIGKMEAVYDSINEIENATTDMTMFIDNLLEYSRSGKKNDTKKEIDVTLLLKDLLRQRANIGVLNADVTIEENLPTVFAGPVGAKQVFQNLLDNAVKYGSDNPDPKIIIGGKASGDEVLFFIKDNGAGIPEEYHEKIFHLFERLTTEDGGSGAGLAIVRKVMGLHNGRAWVESAPGKGATFWISFPAHRPDLTTSMQWE